MKLQTYYFAWELGYGLHLPPGNYRFIKDVYFISALNIIDELMTSVTCLIRFAFTDNSILITQLKGPLA